MRTFIAVPLAKELLRTLAELQNDLKKRLIAENFRLSWVRADGIHLTLRFLGEIEEALLEPICGRLENVCQKTSPFKMTIKGLGAFPSTSRPRIIWIGLHDTAGAAASLHSLIRKSVADLPLDADDKVFKPHLTLARIKDSSSGSNHLGKIVEEKRNEQAGILAVNEIRLYRSHLKSSGAEYEVLRSFDLSG